jgi:hypothetical protein
MLKSKINVSDNNWNIVKIGNDTKTENIQKRLKITIGKQFKSQYSLYAKNHTISLKLYPRIRFRIKLETLTNFCLIFGMKYDQDNYIAFMNDSGSEANNWYTVTKSKGRSSIKDTRQLSDTELHIFEIAAYENRILFKDSITQLSEHNSRIPTKDVNVFFEFHNNTTKETASLFLYNIDLLYNKN